ncbi:cas scaffolding protein family member 4 [Chanos chanos]|uniref:Cas scaffolding protein family member 4 n=1 Tax=Chanos chanos TaxID=29144 RepID=A0A6J2VMJ2_CHACN|nr:cas scaffolding protein family member 4 [Chanos chanos]
MKPLLAKALYDNTADCADELAFRRGDILMVIDQNVADGSGWWKCSLHGRQGLAPANRLSLLKPSQTERAENSQNIYQIPKVPRPTDMTNENMDRIYEIPSVPRRVSESPQRAQKHTTDAAEANKSYSSPTCEAPNTRRRISLNTEAMPRNFVRKTSLMVPSEIQKYQTYAIPPLHSQDPNYDIPVPSTSEAVGRPPHGYSTLPNPRKPEWIYDVPVSPEKSGGEQAKAPTSGKQLYDTLPARAWPAKDHNLGHSLYDIPKPSLSQQQHMNSSPVKEASTTCIYDTPPCLKAREVSLNAGGAPDHPGSHDSHKGHVPLECRADNGLKYDHPRRQLRSRVDPMRSYFSNQEKKRDDDEEDKTSALQPAADSQRSSTASTSSTLSSSSRSSCDSLVLSTSSPELLREVTLTQEEAGRKLLELQNSVCQVVPQLMEFVSSNWRSREHLGQHLQDIRTATEKVADSVTCFLNFALDVRGNARRLTDSNLQARLKKQLCIVEDSGLILQQAVDALGESGWPLDALVQDYDQAQSPNQLERFVTVARTVPEDVKRLVSIINANGKLLFRGPQKEPGLVNSSSPSDMKQSLNKNEQMADSGGDENDYVELQTKTEFEQQQRMVNDSLKLKMKEDTLKRQVSQGEQMSRPCMPKDSSKGPPSDHCRLYFGALQKAISVFVRSLIDGQPPEKFIAHSKLVIMVGQRLVNTLCHEAQSGEASKELLFKSNHLCALLKQMAVATKKAALHFPDKLALQEAQDLAKELAQRAQHFRLTLDI